jgi:hypothetical protein
MAMGKVALMDHLNLGFLQLGLVALAFAGLQVWWISTTIRKRDLARPLSEREFRRSLERIWAKRTSRSTLQRSATLRRRRSTTPDF